VALAQRGRPISEANVRLLRVKSLVHGQRIPVQILQRDDRGNDDVVGWLTAGQPDVVGCDLMDPGFVVTEGGVN
jgi:hypothetical protein